jgi:transposase-like protein
LQWELGQIATHAGTTLVQMLMDGEVAQLVGKPYGREGEMSRWGSQPGFVQLGGRKVHVQRPRVRERTATGTREVPLKSYLKFQHSGDRAIRVFREFLAQVSTRDYAGAIETMRAGYGISKSVVSREVVAVTTAELDRFRSRSLEDFNLCVLLIDGIELDETVFIAALGIDDEGRKRFPGFLEGATENSVVCKAMIEDLIARGLRLDQPFLAVLDGAKAPRRPCLISVGEETLTMHRLQLTASLRKHFSSTNSIESAYARARKIMRNVKRWTSSRQENRWIATALLKAEKGFRRLSGYADMPQLTVALNAEHQRRTLDRIAA